MRKVYGAVFVFALALGPVAALGFAQASRKAPETAASRAAKGIDLAARGFCRQALPLLAAALPHLFSRKQLLYQAAMARAKCGMSLGRMTDAVEALALLNREFPDDPQVLYATAHSLSQLSDEAARKLVTKDPSSAPAMEIRAESLDSRGKAAEAIKLYHQILEKYPRTPGIHYRLGLILAKGSPTDAQKAEAKKEFEEELKVVPHSAASEFMLGDMAWEAQNLPEAITHFSLATQYDVGFLEADLALGVALNASKKYAKAIAPLEKYVRGVPADPAGHYQLAIAYARTGHMKKAKRQMALQQAAANKAQHQQFRTKNPDSPN